MHKYRATCHAHLGDEAAAMAAFERMGDTTWTPGSEVMPAGTREEVATELRRIARAAAASR